MVIVLLQKFSLTAKYYMKSNENPLYTEWFDKAGDDELSITAILKEGASSTACFLSQQMAEKYLKGLLVYFGEDFPKVHDLLELETRLMIQSPSITQLHIDLQKLNRFYIESRYPGDYPEFTRTEAVAAFEAAKRVKNAVMEIIFTEKR